MKKGLITKLIGGLYTVYDGEYHTLKPIGKFRYTNVDPKVGDNVSFDERGIYEVEPRKNNLVRPYISNVDQVLIVCSSVKPDFSFELLDKFLLLIEKENITPIILVTKIDLLEEDKLQELKSKLSYYQEFYKVIYFSKFDKEIEEIKQILNGKITVLAGQTGAGKSSFLNVINPEFNLQTGEISEALGRGKHTTRHTELHKIEGGFVADTPGFSSLDLTNINYKELKDLYPEFRKYLGQCKFIECYHINEPNCKVKEALNDGLILKERYNTYLKIYNELYHLKPVYRKEK